jgi:hypothetical protein
MADAAAAKAEPASLLKVEKVALRPTRASVAQSDREAKRRIREFLEHRTAKVKPGSHDRKA